MKLPAMKSLIAVAFFVTTVSLVGSAQATSHVTWARCPVDMTLKCAQMSETNEFIRWVDRNICRSHFGVFYGWTRDVNMIKRCGEFSRAGRHFLAWVETHYCENFGIGFIP